MIFFNHDADSPLYITHNEAGIKSINDFITMSPHNIEDLTYTQSVGNEDATEPDFTSTMPLQLIFNWITNINSVDNITLENLYMIVDKL